MRATEATDAGPEQFRRIITQAWTGMFLLLLMMMVADLVEMGMTGQFSLLSRDPGVTGLRFIIVVACSNVVAQAGVVVAQSKSSRWAIFGFAVVYLLVFVGHLVNHAVMEGLGFHSLLDFAHTSLGIWASIAAYRLAKS